MPASTTDGHGPINSAERIASVYDQWYMRMWAEEQGGDRFERELRGLTRLIPDLPGHRAVLDLGSGFGRMANELARRGFEVTGVELSEELRRMAEESAAAEGLDVRYVGGDWIDYVPDAPAACVLLWGTTYGHRGAPGDAESLEVARGFLAPGGALLIELRNWGAPARDFERATLRRSGGAELFEEHSYDIFTATQHTTQTLVVEGRVLKRQEYRLRRYAVHEIVADCRRAGFDEVDAFEIDGGRASAESDRIVVRAVWNGGDDD